MNNKKNITIITPVSDEELNILSEIWEKDQKIQTSILKKNKDQYWEKRNEILKEYKGKYIAFSDGKVLGSSETFDGVSEYAENNPSVFTTLVGNEKYKPDTKDVLIHSLRFGLYSEKNKSKTCFQ